MSDDAAHERVDGSDINYCVHATWSDLLPGILGLSAPGLLPGGLKMGHEAAGAGVPASTALATSRKKTTRWLPFQASESKGLTS